MALWQEIVRRSVYLARGSRFDRELQDEIQFHLDMRAGELQQTGLTRSDAIAQARREFGSSARAGEQVRAGW